MKKQLTIICTLLALTFSFISCASSKVVSSEQNFTDEKAVIEAGAFQVTQAWTPEKSGTYYLVVKADMSSDQGLTLTMYNYQTSTDVYFRRVPYAKYSVEVK